MSVANSQKVKACLISIVSTLAFMPIEALAEDAETDDRKEEVSGGTRVKSARDTKSFSIPPYPEKSHF